MQLFCNASNLAATCMSIDAFGNAEREFGSVSVSNVLRWAVHSFAREGRSWASWCELRDHAHSQSDYIKERPLLAR